jgi:hypothetical protein
VCIAYVSTCVVLKQFHLICHKPRMDYSALNLYVLWTCRGHLCIYENKGQNRQVGIAVTAGWAVLSSNSSGGEICCTHPDRPQGPCSLLYDGYSVSFPRGKAAVAWPCPPTPSIAEVKEGVELYLCSLSGPLWPVVG